MHLFALLIAAVLSTEFTAPNENEPTFTVTPNKIHSNANCEVVVTRTDAPTAWTADVKILFTLSGEVPTDPELAGWVTPNNIATNAYTITTYNFGTLIGVTGSPKVYVWVMTGHGSASNAVAILPDPFVITVEDGWWMTYDLIDEDTRIITNIKVTGPAEAWDVDDDLITVCIVKTPPESGSNEVPTCLAKAEDVAFVDGETTAAAEINITSLNLVKDDNIYAFILFNETTQANTLIHDENPQTLTVQEATVKFAAVTDPTTVTVATDTVTKITITNTGLPTWQISKPIKVVASVGEKTLESVDFTYSATPEKWEIASYDMTQFGRRLTGDKLVLKVSYDTDTTGTPAFVQLKKPLEITLTGNPAAADFTVEDPEELDEEAATFTVSVKKTSPEEWTGTIAVYVTPDPRVIPAHNAASGWHAAEEEQSANGDKVYTTGAITTSTIGTLTGKDEVYVWIRHTTARASNAAAVLPAPAVLPIKREVSPVWTVDPATLTFAAPLVTVEAELTAEPATELTAAHRVGFSYDGGDPLYVNVSVKSTQFYIPAGFNLDDLEIPADATFPVTINCAVVIADDTPVGDPFIITVNAPPPKPFTVAEPTAILEANKATPQAFKILPGQGQAWADAAVKLTITLDGVKPTGETPPFTGTITKGEGAHWEGTVNLAELVVPPANQKVYAHVKVGEADYFADKAEITYTHAAEPEAQFSITPNKATEGKLTKDDSPEFTIAILEDFEKPAKAAGGSKVVFTAGDESLTVEFTAGGTTEAPTWKIAEKETDFSKLKITTFPTTGSVAFYPDKAGVAFGPAIPFTFEAKAKEPEAAMGVSPLLSLLAALVFLFVKLF